MSFTQTNTLALGSGLTGITADLRGQLIDTDGTSVGAAITTGFVEVGAGNYLHTFTSPETTEAAIKYYRESTGDVLAVAPTEGQAYDVYTGVLAIGAGRVSVSSPVTASGKVTLYSGYDHLGALRLTFTEPEGSTWPTSLVGAEVHLLAQTGHGTGAVTADIEGDVLVDTGDEKVIRFAPTAAETEPLTATTTGKYDLYAIIDTDEVPLVVGGQLIVRDRIPE